MVQVTSNVGWESNESRSRVETRIADMGCDVTLMSDVHLVNTSGFETAQSISSGRGVQDIHTIHFTSQQRHSVSKHMSKQMVRTIPLAYSYSYSQNLPKLQPSLSSHAPTFSLSLSLSSSFTYTHLHHATPLLHLLHLLLMRSRVPPHPPLPLLRLAD